MTRGITYEDTINAINNLVDKKNKITIDSIRVELGDTGSRTTISKFLRQWREFERPGVIQSIHKMELSPSISKTINQVIQDKYEEARTEFNQRLNSAEEDIVCLENNLVNSEEKNKTYLNKIKELESQIIADNMHFEKTTNEIAIIKKEALTTIQAANSKAEQERTSAESARLKSAKFSLQLEGVSDLKSEVNELRLELKMAFSTIATAEKEAAIAKALLEEKKEQISILKKSLENFNKYKNK